MANGTIQLLRTVQVNCGRTLNALGLLLAKTNRIDEAVSLYTKALYIREKALGPDHPHTILIRGRLAEISAS